MDITLSNTYIKKDGMEYIVCIEMPDGSRNFLHNEKRDLESAIITREIIDGMILTEDMVDIRTHDKYLRYYQVIVMITVNDEPEIFHSRALNLNDVISERYNLLVGDDDR